MATQTFSDLIKDLSTEIEEVNREFANCELFLKSHKIPYFLGTCDTFTIPALLYSQYKDIEDRQEFNEDIKKYCKSGIINIEIPRHKEVTEFIENMYPSHTILGVQKYFTTYWHRIEYIAIFELVDSFGGIITLDVTTSVNEDGFKSIDIRRM